MTHRSFGLLALAALVLAVPSRADDRKGPPSGVAVSPAAAVPAAGPGAVSAAPLNLDQRKLSRAEFQALPDGQLLLFRGQRLTAGQAKARMLEVRNRSRVLLQQGTPKFRAHLASARQKFLSAQTTKLNIEVAQGLARYRAQMKTRSFALTR